MTKFFVALFLALAGAGAVVAQDTTRVDEGVRVGVDYGRGWSSCRDPDSTPSARSSSAISIIPTGSRWLP